MTGEVAVSVTGEVAISVIGEVALSVTGEVAISVTSEGPERDGWKPRASNVRALFCVFFV